MPSPCDHTSVGIVVERDGRILLIERARGAIGFALPAGHVDGDTNYEAAAVRELHEETGLRGLHLELLATARKENLCRREGGTWHQWKVYRAVAEGNIVPSRDEAKRVGWYSLEERKTLAKRTKDYQTGKITETDWQAFPGLEPVMYDWFTELHLI